MASPPPDPTAFLESCLWALIEANDDASLTELCRKMVKRVLVALRSDAARAKALEVVKTLSSRVKNSSAVLLPVEHIYDVFADPDASPYEKNIALMFLEMGWKRAPQELQAKMVLAIAGSVGNVADNYQITLLQMVLSAIEHVGSKTSTSWTTLSGAHAKVVRGFLLDVLLFAPPGAGQARADSAAASTTAPASPAAPPLPPGMSAVALDRLQTKLQLAGGQGATEYLMARKLAVMKALSGKILSDSDTFPLAIVASTGAAHEVRRAGEDLVRTLTQANRVDLDADEAEATITTLFNLLLGTSDAIKRELQAGGGKSPAYMGSKSPTLFVSGAVDVPTRVVLLAHLCRSMRAANTFPQALQAIFQGLYGADSNARLKHGAMQFALWTTRNARSELLTPIAPVILSGLLKFIAEDDATATAAAAVQLRGFTFSAVGQLACRAPQLFKADVGIAERLFASLATETAEVKVSVQEALSMACSAYRGIDGEAKERLMRVLLDAVAQNSAHQVRFCAVYWANRLFAFSDVRARYISLLAVADAKIEVREEAALGLLLPAERRVSAAAKLTEVAAAKHAQPESLLHAEDAAIKAALALETYPVFEDMVRYLSTAEMLPLRRAQPAGVKAAVVAFCNKCLAKSCLRAGGISKAEYLGAAARDGSAAGEASQRQVAAEEMNSLIEDALVTALGGGGKGVVDADLARQCLVALIDLQMASSDVVQRKYGARLTWLDTFVFSTNSDTRELAASIYGQLTAAMPAEAAEGVVLGLLSLVGKDAQGKDHSVEKRQGSMLALGYTLSYAVDAASNTHSFHAQLVRDVMLMLTLALSDRRAEIVSSAARAIGLAAVHSSLPLPPGRLTSRSPGAGKEGEGGEGADKDVATDEVLTVVRVVRALGAVVNRKGDDKDKNAESAWKECEDAAHATGMLAVSNRHPDILAACRAMLEATAGLKRTEEFHLCIGEALACVAGGRTLTSPQLLSQLRLPPAYQDAGADSESAAKQWAAAGTPDANSDVLVGVMEHVMNEVLTDGKPIVRSAGAAWLLCLLRYNSESPEVQARIALFQEHFAFLLQERSEYLQEVASKGLGLCYDMCSDDAIKDELVATLAKALMSGVQMQRPKRLKADDNEQLFEEGEMKIDDKNLGEGSLTTYKELCTVATELGQPELIYRFLNLAGHQKVWNSRRGAAFGFSLIANKAADRLKPHLASLIPKLYRYQYDPNQSIQDAMSNLWVTVVPDPDKAKEEYLPHIFRELIPGVGSRLWRVREASCLALADLLAFTRRFSQVEEFVVEVYRMSLRAIDDVKETVRKAGQQLNRAVSGLCAKLSDPSQSDASTAETILGLIIPLLLQEGIAQAAAEVRVASVQQLVKLTKHAGSSLSPHIPELAAVLLESLSSLEPQMNTYLQLNADKYQISDEALERARVSASRNSPLAETLDLCMRHMTAAAASALVPRVVGIVRQGVGLPTRCGTARFIGQLAVTPGAVGQEVRKMSGKLLKALAGAVINDRSAVVRQAMAAAAARVVAVAKEGAIEEYLAELTGAYLERGPEDLSLRVVVAQACKDLVSAAADAIKDYLPQLLPLVFVGKHDESKDASDLFVTVWEEAAGSTSAGLRLYSKEISDCIRRHLASSSWVVRKMAAKAALACVAGGEAGGGADAARAGRAVALMPALMTSMSSARLWDGKECVVQALAASIVTINEHSASLSLANWRDTVPGGASGMNVPGSPGDSVMTDASTCVSEEGTAAWLDSDVAASRHALVGCLVAQCHKKKVVYRKAVLIALKETLEKLDNVDVASQVLSLVEDIVAAGEGDDGASSSSAPSAGRDADEEARYEAIMQSKGQQELRARACEALAAAWPSRVSTRMELAPAVLQLMQPLAKSPAIEERLAATSVFSRMAERMTQQLEAGEEDGVRQEWGLLAPAAIAGLYVGMNDFGPTRRAVRKAALCACQLWFGLGSRLGTGTVGAAVGTLRVQLQEVFGELMKDETDVKMKENALALLNTLQTE